MCEETSEVREALASADRLYSAGEVHAAIRRMAEDINRRTQGRDTLVVSILNGGIVPTGLLLPQLNFPLQMDTLHVSRYRGATAGGQLHWISVPQEALNGRNVLLIDDILDEGRTLAEVINYCRAQRAAEVTTAVLIDKRHARKFEGIQADIVGLPVEDRYVFGFGMDYKGYLRNAPGIFAVAD